MTAWKQNVFVEGRPLLTVMRGAAWVIHCALRMAAVIELEPGGPIVELTPRLRKYGSTSVYMKRLAYEPALTFLAGLVRDGDVVLDVGANIGLYALLLAKRAGLHGQVYAFEPGAEALSSLRRNCDRNPALNINIAAVALSDAEGTGTLYHIGGPTTYSLGTDVANGEPVRLTTLDTWARHASPRGVDLMKVDVEGHEPAVFDGGRKTIEVRKPLIMFEVSATALARGGYSADATGKKLMEMGYALFRLHDSRSLEPVGPAEEGNLIALHPQSSWTHRIGSVGARA